MYKQTLYSVVSNIIPEKVIRHNNKNKLWSYGYNKEYDVIIISRTGEIGEIYSIQGLIIALPKPTKCFFIVFNRSIFYITLFLFYSRKYLKSIEYC